MSSDGRIITKLLGLSGSIRRESFNTAILLSMAERLRGDVTLSLHPLNEVPAYNQDCDGDLTPAVVALLQNVGEAPNQKPKQCGKRKEPQDEVGDNIIRIG